MDFTVRSQLSVGLLKELSTLNPCPWGQEGGFPCILVKAIGEYP